MKITNVKDFRNKATSYLKEDEPVLVVRHGKVAGMLLPFKNTESLPLELKKELIEKLGDYISNTLEEKNISEEDIIGDFKKFKKTRKSRS